MGHIPKHISKYIAWWVKPTAYRLRKTHNKALLWIYRLSRKPPLVGKFVIFPMLACNVASSKLKNRSPIRLSKLLKVSKTKFEFSLGDAFKVQKIIVWPVMLVKISQSFSAWNIKICYFNLPICSLTKTPWKLVCRLVIKNWYKVNIYYQG